MTPGPDTRRLSPSSEGTRETLRSCPEVARAEAVPERPAVTLPSIVPWGAQRRDFPTGSPSDRHCPGRVCACDTPA